MYDISFYKKQILDFFYIPILAAVKSEIFREDELIACAQIRPNGLCVFSI